MLDGRNQILHKLLSKWRFLSQSIYSSFKICQSNCRKCHWVSTKSMFKVRVIFTIQSVEKQKFTLTWKILRENSSQFERGKFHDFHILYNLILREIVFCQIKKSLKILKFWQIWSHQLWGLVKFSTEKFSKFTKNENSEPLKSKYY